MDHWINRYLMRLRCGQVLHLAADWTVGFLLLFGSAVLAVKLLIPAWWPGVLWLGLGWVPAVFIAWWIVRADTFSRVECIALLDRRLDARGLLMTLSEAPDARWMQQLPGSDREWRMSLPRIRPRRFVRTVALPFLFAVGACLVPLREAKTGPNGSTAVGREAAGQLHEVLELMQNVHALDAEEQAELAEQIEKLTEEAALNPISDEKWETVDALRDRMGVRLKAVERSVAQASQAVAALSRAEGSESAQATGQHVEALEDVVEDVLNRLADTGALSQSAALKSIQEQQHAQNDSLKLSADPQERQQELAELQKLLEQELQRLAECRQQYQTRICTACGNKHQDGDCPLGSQSPGRESRTPSREAGSQASSPSGNAPRGPGSPESTWGSEPEANKSRFREVILPAGILDDPQQEVIAVSAAQPNDDANEAAARSPLREGETSTGHTSWNRRLRPRHRSVVKQYFDSQQ